jgi:hypothetical protein
VAPLVEQVPATTLWLALTSLWAVVGDRLGRLAATAGLVVVVSTAEPVDLVSSDKVTTVAEVTPIQAAAAVVVPQRLELPVRVQRAALVALERPAVLMDQRRHAAAAVVVMAP